MKFPVDRSLNLVIFKMDDVVYISEESLEKQTNNIHAYIYIYIHIWERGLWGLGRKY